MTVSPVQQDQLMARLNQAQQEAVLYGDGPLLVLAGAGSGKTRVLTTRIADLIERRGVRPSQILAVTFTNKAAGEMRHRIARLLGSEPAGMWCGTFHAIGARLIRRHAEVVGRTQSFTIYDEDDLLGVIRRIMERLRMSTKDRPPQAVAALLSDARNALIGPEEYSKSALDPFSRDVARVFRELEPALRSANAAGFDDLLTLPVELLQREDILTTYQRRFRHILVDEYQDTNRAQYRLISQLGAGHGNVTVVGDDDQSIYGWRGADIRNIRSFESDFASTGIVRLEENYRSTPQILELANAAIRGNTGRLGKTLRPTRDPGDKVAAVAALDERDESDHVVEQIQHRRYQGRGRPLRDFAILYRTNAQSRAHEESLRRAALPYRLVGATRFYDRREIRDLIAWLRLIANPADNEAFRRAVAAPRRGVGETTLEVLASGAEAAGRPLLAAAADPSALAGFRPAARSALHAFAALINGFAVRARDMSVDQLLEEVANQSGYREALVAEGPEGEDRLNNVRELITGAAEIVVDDGGEVGLSPLDHFLQHASLVAGVDGLDPNADAVTLMTLHNAKGLEFPVVFLTGLEEGLFPTARAIEEPHLLEEERRLFYVGITRAEDVLVLTHARSRRRNGETRGAIQSSFLRELPQSLLTKQQTFRLRGSARIIDREDAGWGWGYSGSRGVSENSDDERRPSVRRPGSPVFQRNPADEESQDVPAFRRGERVAHARFGEGIISDVTGSGREAKVTVDFDDENVGRKRLVIVHAGLSRAVS
ncbi:MAG: ATP-dependent helicase [Gemmatimonadota bacterium]